MLSTMPMSSSGTCMAGLSNSAQLAAVVAGQAEGDQPMTVGPIDRGQHVGAVARAADGDHQIAAAAVVHQLLNEDLVVAHVVADGQNPALIVGQAHNLEPLLAVVFQVFGLEQALAEVFAHVAGGGAGAAVAEDEDKLFILPGGVNQVGPVLELGMVDAIEFLFQSFQVGIVGQRGTKHCRQSRGVS